MYNYIIIFFQFSLPTSTKKFSNTPAIATDSAA